jgi:hypothetical protein
VKKLFGLFEKDICGREPDLLGASFDRGRLTVALVERFEDTWVGEENQTFKELIADPRSHSLDECLRVLNELVDQTGCGEKDSVFVAEIRLL